MPKSAAVSAWLSKFEAALSSSDSKAAAALFGDECYWRDLVSFTWNIKTMEGRSEIDAMLAATLAQVKPSNWQIQGEARKPTASPRAGSPLRRACRAGLACCA